MSATETTLNWTIETERLILRIPDAADANRFASFHAENESFLTEFGSQQPGKPIEYWVEKVAACQKNFLDGSACTTIILLKSNLEMVGSANLSNIIRGNFQACILGYYLGSRFQGFGYMHEALTALTKFGFETLNLHRVMANYVPWNRRSHNVLERLGFVVEGYSKRYLLINGVWEDHVLTALTNNDWKPL